MSTVTIIPNQDFKHGNEDFEKGQQYEVSNDEAQYFTSAGWVGAAKEISSHTLTIHSLKVDHSSEVN